MTESKDTPKQPATKVSMFYWAFHGNLKLQIILLTIIVVIVFARVLPLEMQKRIINEAIALKDIHKLMLYCGIYLLSVTVASLLKLAINYIQALIGERAMLAMRESLYDHILTLPLGFFRRTQPGMVVSALMTELSAAGTFAGMAFAVPITNILTLVAFAGYLAWLHTSLAMLTLVIYPIVVFILPLLQKKSNKANKERVDVARKVSSQIAECVTGVHEVQVHGAYQQESRKFFELVKQLKAIRIRWSLLKFGIKTVNNYFVSLGPFLVFIYGGYLVMNGQLGLGSMVAFLSAQEKLFDPWKELIDFYQVYQDASVRYKRTMQYFDVTPEFLLEAPPVEKLAGKGDIEVKNLSFTTPEGHVLLNNINLKLAAGEHMALVGFSGSGKSTLIQCMAKMYQHSEGSILIDDVDIADISKNTIVNRVGYISQRPFIFTGTVAENLLYADRAAKEAIDGVENYVEPDLDRMILALQQAGFFVDVMRFGLDSIVDSGEDQIEAKVINVRPKFRERFGKQLARYVEFYNNTEYLYHSSLVENLIFGVPAHRDFALKNIASNEQFCAFLQENGLTELLEKLGGEITRSTLDLLAGLDNPELIFEHSPIPTDQFEAAEKSLRRFQKGTIKENDSIFFISLALQFTPAIHTMVSLPLELKNSILDARVLLRQWVAEHCPEAFTFYSRETYIQGQSLLNNIFFGRSKLGMPHAQEKINQAIIQLLIEEDVLEKVAHIGMHFEVGSAGDRLSGGQRQKLAISRVLLKNPSIVIMDEATSALDNASQTRIQRLIDTRWKKKRTVVAVIHRMDDIESFDRIGVMKAGKLVEIGTYTDLIEKKGIFHELIFGKK